MGSTDVTRPRNGHWGEETVLTALQLVAAEGGSTYRAARRLKEQGVDVPRSTIRRWRDHSHAEKYLDIRDEHQGKLQRIMAARHEDLVTKGADVTEKLWARLGKEAGEIPARDLPGAVRNAATALGISTDKVLTTRERPVVMPAASRSFGEIVNALVGLGVAKVDPPVDATVVEDQPSAQPERSQ